LFDVAISENEALRQENAALRQDIGTLKDAVAKRDEIIEDSLDTIADLTAKNEAMQKKIDEPKKNSSNSHISPANNPNEGRKKGKTDKPKDEEGETKKKKGAQPGHPASQYKPFNDDEVDFFKDYLPPSGDTCSDCGSQMTRSEEHDRRMDQLEVPDNPILKVVHRGIGYVCPGCGKVHVGEIPEEVTNQGLISPSLAAFIGQLNTTGRVSLRSIQEILESMNVHLSLGAISKTLFKLGNALDGPYKALIDRLPDEPRLFVDETGFKENGRKCYVWGFNTKTYVVFVIGMRSASIIETILGKDYDGIINCDYYAAYRAFLARHPEAKLQFCHAHLIRDFKYLSDHLDKATREYGESLLAISKRLMELWHDFVINPDEELHRQLRECAEDFKAKALEAPEGNKKAQAIAKRFKKYPDSYFSFINEEGVEPTNNEAERSFRFIALARRISQGTRSEAGRRARERLWTAFATCRKQKKSVLDYFKEAYSAYCAKRSVPSLLG
jgi:transposase